jgi:hypothetical protein
VALVLAVLLPGVGIVLGLALAGAGVYLYRLLTGWANADSVAQAIQEDNQTPATVDTLPRSPNFILANPGSAFRASTGTTDSPVAVRFKTALRDSYALVSTSKAVSVQPAPLQLDLRQLTLSLVASIDPQVTIPRRGLSVVRVPPWIIDLIGDDFVPVMAYPKIDTPMYEPLKIRSVELFLPNINLIPPNSITLVETNQQFIEAYMVGLNHEFARKLLWREFPTDQRGSYFRQFWDARSHLETENLTPDQLQEKLYDIPELHRWQPTSKLGDHNNRASVGQVGEQAVLVIRGELLKKYPTAVIFAQLAVWPRNADNSIDLTKPRTLVPLDPSEEAKPPRTKVRTPLYEAKADPDIYFFGFDLSIEEAKGQSGQNPTDAPGWFFVIKERPGEPRFGLELTGRGRAPEILDELTWTDASPGIQPGQFLPATSLSSVALASPPPGDVEGKQQQHDEDVQIDGAAVSSARWAYILYRAPVMVAVHADEMLTRTGA